MPPRRRKKDTVLVALAWGLNIIGLIAVAVVFAAYWLSRPASAAPQTENQQPLQSQIDQVITATFQPLSLPCRP